MRLIDADEFIKKFRYAEADTEDEKIMCATVRRMIKEQPTAFDAEKVIALLEEELKLADDEKARCIKENPIQFDSAKGYAHGIAVAIEIVKRGGRDEE